MWQLNGRPQHNKKNLMVEDTSLKGNISMHEQHTMHTWETPRLNMHPGSPWRLP